MNVTLSGHIECRTSGSAFIPASVSADIAVTAAVAIPDCTGPSVSVRLTNIGGLGRLVAPSRDTISRAIEGALLDVVNRSCRSLFAPQ